MVNTILATVLRYMTTHSLALCIAGLQSHTQLSNINIQFNSIRVLSAKCANVKAYNTKKHQQNGFWPKLWYSQVFKRSEIKHQVSPKV